MDEVPFLANSFVVFFSTLALSIMEQQQISIDIKSLSTKARRRMRTSKEETAILESYYRQNPNPTNEHKQRIAKEVEMGARNVHFWFQNRRAKDNKRKKLLQQKQKEFGT
ncbi:uncharacterized protein BX663DRAFT_527363 [Cokeromyces recurvatus]|uniref:uncharacterized protein n=1 Tax=Cokeromyces recurvatus TaxID=90255 RepID=UPI00221EDEA7|nr:uncharacterized protein BX663DRAFT_527363 [Cokeromyces recurvatus]KAI7897732.1 hypothetical protein BX663DRAFT_527363 [Cokeromyces recurvatus]